MSKRTNEELRARSEANDQRTTPNMSESQNSHFGVQDIPRRAVFAGLLAAAGITTSLAMPRDAYGARASQETLDSLASAEEQLDAVQKQLDSLAGQFQELSVKQDETITQIESVNVEIEQTEEEIEKLQEELSEKQDTLASRVAKSYKNGPTSLLNLLLTSESFDELLSNTQYISKMNSSDQQIIEEVQKLRTELQEKKSSLEEQKKSLEELKDQQAQQLSDMQAKQQEISELLNGLSQEVKDLMAQRDAEYLAAVQEEERQRQEAANSNKNNTGTISGGAKSLERVLSACHATPSPGAGYCAMWVSKVFYNAGFSYAGGNACDMYNSWCTSSNQNNLQPGMIIAVSSHPHTSAGRVYGHVGIYVGNGVVMENVGPIKSTSLSSWLSYYGATVTPRWGWLCGWQLQ